MAGGDYASALLYLFSATDYEKMRRVRYNADTFSLDRVHRLLAMIGSPHARLRSVHVAGTKGKGSTAAILHAVALGCGLKAGLYTSPHLVDLRERIRVGDRMISQEDLAARIAAIRPSVERLRGEGDAPTFFEIFTALAFDHFDRVGVDLAVVEVGLGGRLDATNVLAPDVAVITAISLDHTLQLGDTLAAIAAEKAGIIKPGVPVVSQPQPDEAARVIERACRETGAPLAVVGRDVTYTWSPAERDGRPGVTLNVTTPAATYGGLFLPLMGEHQAVNAATALAAAEQCPILVECLSPEGVRVALERVVWPGRMEYVPGTPPTVIDGAHNRASMERLVEALARHFPNRPVTVVFGSAADKDVDGMLAVLADQLPDAPVFFTRTNNPRAADPADLAARYRALAGREAVLVPDVAEAVRRAADAAGSAGLVVVCGSLYLVGEVKAKNR
ncbi:MAG: bifunctional folylpolyglutamate synthase/dihydrofolate synthase [Planctomycetes bacterium]|nr:bifunctional folylpolyglutamate synthase/dihydrofolate synthase [Planctomycetota bacterium]